jgi:probable HAF family extracellular repeat protein
MAGKATFTSGGPFHAFNTIGQPPFMANANDLGTMGGTSSEAWGINDIQGTVGRAQISQTFGGYWRAFLLPTSCNTLGGTATYQISALPGVTRQDWSSAAYGINSSGLAVGYTQDQNLASRAFRYNNASRITTDLNTITLVGGQTPATLGWTLTQAEAINDAGVIVGYGTISGRATCWILYPKCQD